MCSLRLAVDGMQAVMPRSAGPSIRFKQASSSSERRDYVLQIEAPRQAPAGRTLLNLVLRRHAGALYSVRFRERLFGGTGG